MLEFLGFLIGIQLTINLFASCYRIIDLWYCIAEHKLAIAIRICVNLAAILIFYLVGNDQFEMGLVYGQLFFAAYHICIFWFGQLMVLILR
ncbi:MAG: hypothetical protein ACI9FB_003048 [Candidatus Azotimanducaceae bacterium]